MEQPQLAPLLRWSSIGLVVTSLASVQNALLQRELNFRAVAIRVLVANTVGGVFAVALAFAGFGVWSLVVQQLASSLASTVYLCTASNYRPGLSLSLPHLRELLRLSSSLAASSVLWFLSTRLDQLIIGRVFGAPTLGLYVVGGRIPELARTLTHQVIAEVSLPALSRLQHDPDRVRSAVYLGMQLNAPVAFAVCVGLAVVANDLVRLLFGDAWSASGPICQLLAIYALVNTLQVFFHPALLASGGAGKYVYLNVLHLGGVLLACAAGAVYGIYFLAASLIVNGLVVALPALLFLRHRLGLSPWRYCRPCLEPLVGSLVMVSTVWMSEPLLVHLPLILRVLSKTAVGAGVYVGFMLIFQRDVSRLLFEIARSALVGDVQRLRVQTAQGADRG